MVAMPDDLLRSALSASALSSNDLMTATVNLCARLEALVAAINTLHAKLQDIDDSLRGEVCEKLGQIAGKLADMDYNITKEIRK